MSGILEEVRCLITWRREAKFGMGSGYYRNSTSGYRLTGILFSDETAVEYLDLVTPASGSAEDIKACWNT